MFGTSSPWRWGIGLKVLYLNEMNSLMRTSSTKNINIKIKGLVQGVGFRPFVYRAALKNDVSGWVKNRQDGILIEASGKTKNVDSFFSNLKNDFPVAAQIQNIQVSNSGKFYKNGFQIILSDENSGQNEITQIGPDIAVCSDCLEDLKIQAHRSNYPFINCTNCGPRFSIIRDLPYDREKTTMDVFKMCPVCKSEYQNPDDRRFHAQPVACVNCGPNYKFISGEKVTEKFDEVLNQTSQFIYEGKTVAIKGIGGFFIACDATNGNAVKRLRKLKNREGKPFAVMFKDTDIINQFCFLSEKEKETLISWQRPILILKSKNKLPESVSNGINTVGAMLPYMPFHYLLFEKLKTPAIVFTSGNFSDEPIIISNKKAETELPQICDAVVTFNREIFNRSDDSLLQVINRKPRLMRRSRGWAPNPVYLNFDVDGILATGAELKNTFCLGKGKQAVLSQHIGDLKDFETLSFYEKNIQQFQKMFCVKPALVVHDFHPEYLSTKYAMKSGLPTFAVQHHHSHIASCMAEHGLDEKVIGVCFDGTGLGDDGNIWGSEFFVCDLMDYKRVLHFEYIPLPGGDAATKEPWKITVSWLYNIYGNDFLNFNLPFLKNISEEKISWIIKAIDKKINCPLTSGSGRLFDSVSALLGLCNYSTFEAEAPMRLENIAAKNESRNYSYKLSRIIDFSKMFTEIIQDLKREVEPEKISAKFHNTISETIINGVKKISKNTGLKKVILSGGTFQNRYLSERTENKLVDFGFQVFTNNLVPCNDGGISLGQLAIAAKRRGRK
jgi:hydrogenase maturation protein HypF